jgi:hypothetical protein
MRSNFPFIFTSDFVPFSQSNLYLDPDAGTPEQNHCETRDVHQIFALVNNDDEPPLSFVRAPVCPAADLNLQEARGKTFIRRLGNQYADGCAGPPS